MLFNGGIIDMETKLVLFSYFCLYSFKKFGGQFFQTRNLIIIWLLAFLTWRSFGTLNMGK